MALSHRFRPCDPRALAGRDVARRPPPPHCASYTTVVRIAGRLASEPRKVRLQGAAGRPAGRQDFHPLMLAWAVRSAKLGPKRAIR